jgi:hypothetical protein
VNLLVSDRAEFALPTTEFVAMYFVEFQSLSDCRYLTANDLARGGSIAIRSGSTTMHSGAPLTPAQLPLPSRPLGSPTIFGEKEPF